MKKIISFLLCLFSLISILFISSPVNAQEKIEINFFYSVTCPHCAEEKVFLDNLSEKYPQIEIKAYEFSTQETQIKLKHFYDQYKVSPTKQGFVPATFIGNRYFIGFSKETTGKEIENYIIDPTQENSSNNSLFNLKNINLPLIGGISAEQYSLPVLAAILGFFDGFNVCSLGALILILGIVLTFGSRTKTLALGSAFILTTAIIYGLLIFVWHKIFLYFAPYIAKMEIIIGLLALGGGIYFLSQFFQARKKGLACQSQGLVQKIGAKLAALLNNTTNLIMIIGAIILFAAIVTIIEFPCSAVLPVLFASIISEANLTATTSYSYIAIFLFFYMLDEIIVFLIAFFTLRIWVSSPKFTLWLNLAASLVLLFLGVYYIRALI